MCELVSVSIWTGGQIRNHATVRCILWCKWLRLSEFHYTLLLDMWSILILPWINVCADLCYNWYRRMTNDPCYCEMYSVVQVIETWWVSLYTITAKLKCYIILPWINVWVGLCYRRTTKESCYCEMHFVVQVMMMIEAWFYTITAQLKHVNFTIKQCLSWSLFKLVQGGD